MKKHFINKVVSLFLGVVLLTGLVPTTVLAEVVDNNPGQQSASSTEIRGIWISFLEMQTMLLNKTEAQFTTNISTAMENIKNYGLNTVYVQVRPYSDALYKSSYFPWSHIVTGVEGKDPGFDPLAIMIKEAHSRGLKIEAWINPYRVRPTGNIKPLSQNSPAKQWIDQKDRAVVSSGTMISYNPASAKAQNLIVAGVKELADHYDIDGIHIDDYFYPTTGTDFDKNFDLTEYNAYVRGGGKLSHGDWRRSNVETLLRKIYAAVKASNPKLVFGISPQSSISNNYSQQYLDIAKILGGEGYCDYIAPQIYFGFKNGTQPFGSTLDQWEALAEGSKTRLVVGLAPYKIGTVDNWAGAGKNEWANSSTMMTRMVEYARPKVNYGGFALYRYDHMFRPAANVANQVRTERANLQNIL